MTDDRPDPPTTGDEVSTLMGFMEFLRGAVQLKTDGLDDARLAARLEPSTMTLGGMLHHLAYVEDWWFGVVVDGRSPAPPWDTVDWQADPDWDWHAAADLPGDELRRRWTSAVDTSRAIVDAHLFGGLDQRYQRGDHVWSLRWVLTHMVEEYGRHAGHADLIRESIDGVTGE